jgi:osmotically-inducible protein OsmY
MRTILLALLLTLAPPPDAAAADTAKAPAAPPSAAADEALQAKIQEKFAKAKAGGGKFQVKVRNGTAYLSGRADVAQHKGAATRMAKAAGAKRVVNNITLSEAGKQKARRDAEQSRPREVAVKPAAAESK